MNESRSSNDKSFGSDRQRFVTTSWSMVVQAGDRHSDRSRLALEQLCEMYWYPLYVFVRRKGHDQTEAEELTQGFFANLLEGDRLQIADQQRGRFRSFLLRSLENFMIQKWRRENTKKRGGDIQIKGLDFEEAERRYSLEPVDTMTAQRIFDRKWAIEVLEQVMVELRRHYESRGKLELFQMLKPHLIQQNTGSWREVADQLSMNEIAVKVTAHRMRQKYRDLLYRLIEQTVDSRSEVEEEIADLFAALSGDKSATNV